MNETRQLAEFVADTRYEDLPEAVVEAVKIYILDNLASGFVGSSTAWAEMVCQLARASAPSGPCSVFARNWGTSPSYASLVNGTMVGSFETDHAFFPGSCHPSAAAFPPAMAVAERDHLDGKSLLLSVALGYEVACRVGLAATRAVEDEAGFHGPGTNASFGGAVGAAKALGLNADQTSNAMGIAGSHAGGLMEFVREGSMTKRIHVGRGAQMGLESASLAAKGFTGPSTVLEGDRGFLRVYSPSPRPELLTKDLGTSYLLLDMTLKAFACHLSFHPVVQGIWEFRESRGIDPSDIQKVRIVGTERMAHRHSDKEPSSILGAQYSLPFSAAVALSRNIAFPHSYSDETLWDPQVRRLATLVDMSPDDSKFGAPGGPAAEITLVLSGSTHTFRVTDWKGAATNPYTYDEMAEKFRNYASPYLDTSAAYEFIHRIRAIEEVTDVAELAGLLRVGDT